MKPSSLGLMKKIGFSVFIVNAIFKNFFFLNRYVKFNINFSSRVRDPSGLRVEENTSSNFYRCMAESIGIYIQAKNGIMLHSCLNIAPGVRIISANHDKYNLSKHEDMSPIKIGENVWLGANAVILPGVEIGNNVIVGAGSIVTRSFGDNLIVAGNPARAIKNND